jgi:hypothetical protein
VSAVPKLRIRQYVLRRLTLAQRSAKNLPGSSSDEVKLLISISAHAAFDTAILLVLAPAIATAARGSTAEAA